MTAERKKALLMMVATFVAGLIIGALLTGMFARHFYYGRDGKRTERKEMREGRKGTLTDRIFKIVKADSNQRKLMKPIIDQTMSRLDEVEDQSNQDAYNLLDSLKVKLRPILASEQMEDLDKFLSAKRKSHEEEERREHKRDHGHH
jgi:hypothetical protein